MTDGGRMHRSIQHSALSRTRAAPAHCTYALCVILTASALLPPAAKATVLTFDVGSNFNGTSIPSGYGDNVDQPFVAGVSYLEGNGWTPDIVVDFLPDFGSYSHWASGYAYTAQGVTLLPHALGHSSFDVPGEIVFTPSSGKRVFLSGFDIGTWLQGSYVTDIRAWDDHGTRANPNIFAITATLDPGIVYRPIIRALAANGPLHLYVNNLGSTGIDNIHFTQTASVPLPGGVWLLGSALVWLGALGRRHSRDSE